MEGTVVSKLALPISSAAFIDTSDKKASKMIIKLEKLRGISFAFIISLLTSATCPELKGVI